MNFKQLETYYWAAKLGSFCSAAQRLNATQSTVSMRIIELERDLGVELFDRSQRTARPTAKGRELMAYAEQAMRLSVEIQQIIGAENAATGILRIGVVEMISVTWLPALMKLIHERFPSITVELDEALTHNLIERLNQGSLDLILIPGRVPGYSTTPVPLGYVDFAWVASPSLGVPDSILTPKIMQEYPIIALSRESYHYTSIEDWFRSGDAYCRRVDTCKSFGVAASLAAAGLGLTLLPPRCHQDAIDSGRLKILETDPPVPRVEFTATTAIGSVQPVARKIARLAAAVSNFCDVPPAKTGRREKRAPSSRVLAEKN